MQRISQRITGFGCITFVVLIAAAQPTLQERGGTVEPLASNVEALGLVVHVSRCHRHSPLSLPQHVRESRPL